MFNEDTNYFQTLEASFRQLYCLKFWLQSVDTSKNYAKKNCGCFFSEHTVHRGRDRISWLAQTTDLVSKSRQVMTPAVKIRKKNNREVKKNHIFDRRMAYYYY